MRRRQSMNLKKEIPQYIFVGSIENVLSCAEDEDYHDIWPKFMVMVFFSGFQKFEIDGVFFSPGANHGKKSTPKVFLLNIAKYSKIRFFDITNDNLTKVMVSAPRPWVDKIFNSFDPNIAEFHPFLSNHLQSYSFPANARILHAARQILHPSKSIKPELLKLHENAMGMEILYESCSAYISSHNSYEDNGRFNYNRFDLAENARSYILDHIKDDINSASIANLMGVNVSTLQRAFKAIYQLPISDFIRKERLKQARFLLETKGIAVSQVGYLVGYNNPSNFATAYRREFGTAPKYHRMRTK